MAPEMLQRRGDARSDVYSLGILLFECLYGDVPFRGDSEWEVLRKHEVAAPEFPPHSLPEDRAIVLRCLAKRPEERFASVGDLLRALQAPVALGESMLLDQGYRRAAAATRSAEPPPLRDSADSPYGMPWRAPAAGTGSVAVLVRVIFSMFELCIFLVLLPVRAVSAFVGRGIVWLFRLPFRILGLLARLIGLLVVFGLILLAAVTLFNLLAAA
jgi:hypothetical protein